MNERYKNDKQRFQDKVYGIYDSEKNIRYVTTRELTELLNKMNVKINHLQDWMGEEFGINDWEEYWRTHIKEWENE